MPGTRVLISDRNGRVVPSGETGEIVIAGPNVSPGYLAQSDHTREVFFHLDGQRAYRTGDRGRIGDGLLFFEGRVDRQIKLNGHRIELGDVEENLRGLSNVRDAVVLPVTRNGGAQSLTAFVVLAAASAGAADMSVRPAYTPAPPPVPVYSWTGPYWGANVGYSWGTAKYDASLTGVGTVSNSQDIDGAIGGVQTGYNYQVGAWVWGLETDIQASGEKGGSTLTGTLPLTSVTTDHQLE
jgi:hypothetical protein